LARFRPFQLAAERDFRKAAIKEIDKKCYPDGMIWLGLFWVLCVVIATVIGGHKNAVGLGCLLGAIFGPIGIALTFVLKADRKRCVFCREYMRLDATVCPRSNRDEPPAIAMANFRAISMRRHIEDAFVVLLAVIALIVCWLSW
jgi:hypothetical protein